MKKVWKVIRRDLWVVLLDIVAVNAAYYLALLLRFYVNYKLSPVASEKYMPTFMKFAPIYTVLAIIVFILFQLYGGMWRYAGINDMNRIVGASLVTTVIQLVGTLVFYRRMPISYYLIGAILQFLFISLIRFGYRILLVEKTKMAARRIPAVPSAVVGAGETALKALYNLKNTPFHVGVIVDEKAAGQTLNGITVTADMDAALSDVKAVFIADPEMSVEKRRELREKCEAKGIELQDYTGYLNNIGGRIPVSGLLELVQGPVTLVLDGKEQAFATGEEALESLREKVEVRSIEGAKISLGPVKNTATAYVGYDAWAQQHKEQTGEDVSFF